MCQMAHRHILLSWRNSCKWSLCLREWMKGSQNVTYAFHWPHLQLCGHLRIIFMLGWSSLDYLVDFYAWVFEWCNRTWLYTAKIGVFISNLWFNHAISLPVFAEYQSSPGKTHFTFPWLDGRNFWPWKVEMVLLWKLISLLPFMSCSTGKMFHY